MSIDLGTTHAPIVIGGVLPRRGLGRHSYLADGSLTENNGTLYTTGGGFIDLGHTRDNADIAAWLALHLRPLLARGEGVLELDAKGGARRIVVERAVPPQDVGPVSDRIAIRAAFMLSVWTELVQYYGLVKFHGAEEIYSAFTPDDPYSNLLGAHLGILALESGLSYDHAMDVSLDAALSRLGAVSDAETRRVFRALEGSWWDPRHAWPSADLAIVRQYGVGPDLAPMRAPRHVIAAGPPVVLDVPENDASGQPLTRLYRIEIRPAWETMARFPPSDTNKVIGEDDIPRLVNQVQRALEAETASGGGLSKRTWEIGEHGPVAHYVSGIRLLELSGAVGARTLPSGTTRAAGGGSLALIRGDTRGGDFHLIDLGFFDAPGRGLVTDLALFRSDALWFCHDPDGSGLRPPLLSMLGPCAPGEWVGMGASLGELLHDGTTGRTGVRPVSLAAVLTPLGNGQSDSYDAVRLLVRLGGEVEHVWSVNEGGRTLPRLDGRLVFLVRNTRRTLEARASAGYRFDPADTHDAAMESGLALGWNFALGGSHREGQADAWGLAQVGVEGSYSYWTRPQNAFPEATPPFVSTDEKQTVQVLLTSTLGIQRLTF